MALQAFTWNNGTNDNPVSLNAQQLAALVALAGRNEISKDVRGHITTVSGVISKYDKYVLNNTFENLVVHATDIEDSFSIVAAKPTIYEGESTVIAVTGLAVSAVDFALEHTITGLSGIGESAVRSKIRMEGNYLVVDAPQENASWRDVVRVKAKPIYEEWSNSSIVRYVEVTVVATAISGITLLGVNKIGCGNTAEISIGITPATSTKLSGLSFANTLTSDGSLPVMQPTTSNGKIYVTAPAEECRLTLTTNAYLFGNTSSVAFFATKSFEVLFPYIRFVVTTDGTFSDISTANPKITLQKVDDNNEPIGDSVELSGTTSGNSLIYEFGYAYGNGVVRGDGSEKFVITAENVKGYTKTFPPNVVPNDFDTIINAAYNVIQTGIYVVYSDGSEENATDVLNRYSFASGKTPCFIRIITADANFAIPFASVTELTNLAEAKTANTSALFAPSGGIGATIGAGVKEIDDANRDGTSLVNRIETYIQVNTGKAGTAGRDPIFKCYEKIITMNGVTYHGYLPLWYHLRVIRMNRISIGALLSLGNSTNQYPTTSNSEENEINRYFVFMRYGDRIMCVYSIPDNLTVYNNDTYGYSTVRGSDWSGDNACIDSNQNLLFKVAPIYFIPQ